MSRTETARASARSQTEGARAIVRSTGESQAELMMVLERLATDLTTIKVRFDRTMKKAEETAQRSATEGSDRIDRATLAFERKFEAVTARMERAITQIPPPRRPWVMPVAMLAAAGIGAMVLIASLILSPPVRTFLLSL